jgi:hypothetical protein
MFVVRLENVGCRVALIGNEKSGGFQPIREAGGA